MFLTALATTAVVVWLGGAGICVWMDNRRPWHVHQLSGFIPVAGVVGALWLIFG